MGAKKYAYINYEILKWAREQSPISIEDIPVRIKNMKSEEVEKWENGIELPSINEAKKLANLYDIPFVALFLSETPKRDTTKYIDRRTYKDNIDIEISYELWKEINRLKSCRENAIEFIDENNYNNIFNSFNENDSINNIALNARKLFNINTPLKNKTAYNNNAFNYFRNKIEKKGVLVLQIEGISIKEIRGVSLNFDILPIIAVNKSDSDRAKVFTLFHELGHLIRRSSNLCLVDFNDKEDNEEKICNDIAANILIPEDIIKNEIINIDINNDKEIEKISDKYAVSKFVIIKRLYDLKKIDFATYKNKYDNYLNSFNAIVKIKKKKGEKKVIPQDRKFVSSSGKLYPSIIFDAYYDGKISFGEMCNTFNVNAKYVESIERMVMLHE